jgi:hypothetical protein
MYIAWRSRVPHGVDLGWMSTRDTRRPRWPLLNRGLESSSSRGDPGALDRRLGRIMWWWRRQLAAGCRQAGDLVEALVAADLTTDVGNGYRPSPPIGPRAHERVLLERWVGGT